MSSENCARIYNESLSNLHRKHQAGIPASEAPLSGLKWHVGLEITPEFVTEGFILHSLLLWHHKRNETLTLPDEGPNNRLRLKGAMQRRNDLMQGTGYDAWNHICDKCCVVMEKPDGTKGLY